MEDGHVTRQQPSGEAESRSSVKFSGSERLADDWWKKNVCASPRQAEIEGGREREINRREKGVMRNKSEGSKRKQSDTDGNVGDEKGEYKKNKKKKTDLI